EVEVVNCAVAGYDVSQEAATVDRLASVLAPDIVLVGFYWNDLLSSALQPAGAAATPDLKVDPGRPFRIGVPPPSGIEALLRHIRTLYVMKGTYRRIRTALVGPDAGDLWNRWELMLLADEETPEVRDVWRGYERDLTRLVTRARQAHSQVVL